MPPTIITTMPPAGFARIAAWMALAASGVFLVLLAALHVLKPDLDPSWRFISEYELGDYGWVMRVAFFALALSCAGMGVALGSQIRTIGGYLGLAIRLARGQRQRDGGSN